MAAFTPVMRTHEGNRPDDCWQYDSDEETLDHLIRMTNLYTLIAPYTKQLVKLNADKGIPLQRPLFMHYEQDEATYDLKYQYLYGEDLLVAPAYLPDVTMWELYLPEGNWIHLWSGEEYSVSGWVTVPTPIGQPPVFYRKESEYRYLFEKARDI